MKEEKNPTTPKPKNNLHSYPWTLRSNTKQRHMSQQLPLLHVLFRTIIGPAVTGSSEGEGKIRSCVATNTKCCTYGKV